VQVDALRCAFMLVLVYAGAHACMLVAFFCADVCMQLNSIQACCFSVVCLQVNIRMQAFALSVLCTQLNKQAGLLLFCAGVCKCTRTEKAGLLLYLCWYMQVDVCRQACFLCAGVCNWTYACRLVACCLLLLCGVYASEQTHAGLLL